LKLISLGSTLKNCLPRALASLEPHQAIFPLSYYAGIPGQQAQEAYLYKVLVKATMLYPVITVSPTASPREAIDLIKTSVLPLGDKF
jgi:hypothetical protein